MMRFCKYQGAGNDFLIFDNRDGSIQLTSAQITALCDRHYGIGADGVMLLENADGYDFGMQYYNSDGSGGMMCGNGGRCIVAFAHRCGIRSYNFLAPDGPHQAEILDINGNECIVRLKMKDVTEMKDYNDRELHGVFLDTGTRHFVVTVPSVSACDVERTGRHLRYNSQFAPIGANVNFICPESNGTLDVRTYEKGVEAETFACGTGIVASAIAHWHLTHSDDSAAVHQPIQALRDKLSVDFTPTPEGADNVWLTGPATYVASIEI